MPLTDAERSARAEADLGAIRSVAYRPETPISLYDAMARAVVVNLDARVVDLERQIAEAELAQAEYDLLPELDGNAGSTYQDRQTSRSDDPNSRTARAGFTWSVLDLGVSYARAQQQANQVLVVRERQRKAANDIMRDVRLAYFRAASADALLRRSRDLATAMQVAFSRSSRLRDEGDRDARSVIKYKRVLLDSVRSAVAYRNEARSARAELGKLLNIPADHEFTLVEPVALYEVPAVPLSGERLEWLALTQRAELRQEDYEARTDHWRSREVIYSLLPGVDLQAGANYSSDRFLVSSSWASAGLQLGMNLFNLFAIPARMEQAEKSAELARQRRIALSAAVLAQLHIARRDYQEALLALAVARRVRDSDRELLRLATVESEIMQGGYLEIVEAAARELTTGLGEHSAYMDVVRAHTDILHATGITDGVADAQSGGIERIDAVADRIDAALEPWDRADDAAASIVEAPVEQLIDAIWHGRSRPEHEDRFAGTGDEASAPKTHGAASNASVSGTERDFDVHVAWPAEIVVAEALAVDRNPRDAAETAMFGDAFVPGESANVRPVTARSVSGDAGDLVLVADEAAASARPDAIGTQAPRGSYYAQAGAYTQVEHATEAVQALSEDAALAPMAERVHIQRIRWGADGTINRVRVGPFAERADAVAVCSRARQLHLACLLVRSRLTEVALGDAND